MNWVAGFACGLLYVVVGFTVLYSICANKGLFGEQKSRAREVEPNEFVVALVVFVVLWPLIAVHLNSR